MLAQVSKHQDHTIEGEQMSYDTQYWADLQVRGYTTASEGKIIMEEPPNRTLWPPETIFILNFLSSHQ